MPRKYERKFLDDGTPNPKWRKDTRPRSARARKSEKSRGKSPSKFERRDVVAWDGEGATIAKKHRLFLMLSSDGFRQMDPDGLDGEATLRRMAVHLSRNPGAIHVGFAYSYDINMMLCHWLPATLASMLRKDGCVVARGIRIEFRPRRWFAVHVRDGKGWAGGKIYDVFGFFQSSFLKALKDYRLANADVLAEIEQMKSIRHRFTTRMLKKIETYCTQEVTWLVELVTALLKSHADANLPLRSYHGAGASAAALLNREQVKAFKGPYMETDRLRAVRDAAQFAYFGGRFELARYGHTEKEVYHYDIRSAYPAAMPYLPCLACGDWTPALNQLECPDDYRFQLVRIRWSFAPGQPLYPFAFRSREGRITYPSYGESWVWRIELNAAHRAIRNGLLTGSIDELECYTYMTACDHQPFAFMPQVYEERAKLKREGNGAEKALKLAINASYGSLARRLGGTKEKPPPFFQMEWAGWITSRTRALLFDAAIAPAVDGHLIMLCADALYSTRELPLGGEGLGSWEGGRGTSITVVQSGVYWLGKDDHEITHYRGFDKGAITRAAILDAWKKDLAALSAKQTRFIGLHLAAQLDRHLLRSWGSWRTEAKSLNLHPDGTTKRISECLLDPEHGRPWERLIPCLPNDDAVNLEAMRQGQPVPMSFASDVPWREIEMAAKADEGEVGDETGDEGYA